MSNEALAEQLFQAFANGDAEGVRSLCRHAATARQNNNPPMSLEELLGFSSAVNSVVSGFRYANAKRSSTSDGFVEEHDVQGTLPDGTALSLAVCVVADVEDGKITALREYFDPSAASALLKALETG